MKKASKIYVYELIWILPSLAIPVGMLTALIVTSFGADIHLPGVSGRVDPTKLEQTVPFDKPDTVQVGPGKYEVRMVGETWSFTPSDIHVPAGAEVTFVATSRDVVHGIFIPQTHTNVMLLPGQVSRVTTHFDKPGTYIFLCHEYCGIAHHTMAGQIVVEPADATAAAGGK